ncbi:ATP-dependent DNA helicase mph1 [Fulvia fulva]|uniref:ATP-dependent DNA helicase n=1 Tax=Passalora fulva TaxID=5499 RepID=A0A9Q8LDL4_PASFU|nr:ATP-dependent DNA helicase mph1 [Fulvia fulva]KAK4629647.1 ATP-dependent DNA helicase mph1 [Fulvia fulva]KAK4629784.1 ATP-dependent DNA helicase mph1 [Fulvia fulva]UJO15545.1 ATP-dependent DNA helicase mph1 [Fulvia fulva]WPV12097.1 ATP-dependent DNA helicase mph1 [Fulvia fulva]WPV27366.1 ATP-dependent DNA helicase mph1 [Fulvia fulva]
MPHSDDFGIDEDDTLFLAAATQVEASQHNGFAPSPRPTKRRRVRRKGPPHLDGASSREVECSETDDEAPSPPKSSSSTHIQSTAAPDQADATQKPSDEAGEDYRYFPGELAVEENTSKRSKYRIHVPENGRKYPDMVFTQTQHGLDEDPTKFRGAIWKRPPAPVQQNLGGIANANGVAKSVAPRPVLKNIGSYFQAQGAAHTGQEDDAALAARLQAEEDALARRRGDDNRPLYDMTQDLDDLPSDAFSSSSPEKSPRKNAIELSSQPTQAHYQRPAGLRGPQTGLKQLTIFGQPATQDLTASQQAAKRHAWPLAARDEAPTHHKLDQEAMKSWVYPTNLGTTRDYQHNIVSRSLFHNTLVALPTGLGKTFIAATVMLNYYRWTTNAQIVFMAPTKPLIAQQMEACYGIVGIPKRDTVLMTGETTPAVRADEWLEKRVFFMTPQTVINDLKTGICDPKKLILLVVDEAHKATGGYAYTEVIAFMRRFNSSFRVLALTATPGSKVEAVQAVIDNLGIARVELRTEQSLDIRQYTHEKQTETEVFDFSPEQGRIMELFAKALKPSVDKLSSQNAYWSRDPMKLTAYGLTTARQKWMQSDAGRKAPQPVKGMMNAIFTVLSSLAHSIGLLKFHGIGPFYSGVIAFQKEVESGQTKGKTATGIAHSEHFSTMMTTMRTWTNDSNFVGHPKLEYVREVVLNHFLDAGEGRQGSDVPPSATRVMIFASYRDSVEEIVRVLKRNEPMIRPHVFVGQAASKGSEGMDQKKQNAVIQDFKSGKFNTLVATSIGEEGLDIGTVDLIVCYDASSSPIRMLQRIGRTGRKRVGRVVLLLMKEKEENDYAKAQDNYAYIQKSIADATKYAYRDDQSPRILPREVKPVCDKRPVEIPVENSQAVDPNEKGRRAKGGRKAKRPPKKFHMPDNVRTGFVTASKLDSESDEPGKGFIVPGKKVVRKKSVLVKVRSPSPSPEPEAATLPSLPSVFLEDGLLQELLERYAQTAGVEGDGIIAPPNALRFPEKYRSLGPTKHVRHGRAARLVENAMKAIHGVDAESVSRMEAALQMSDLEDAGPARVRLVSPEPEGPATARIVPDITAGKKPPIRVRLSATAPKPRGRPRKAPPPPPDPAASDSEPELPRPPPLAPPAIQVEKPRGRPRKKQPLQRAVSYGSAAGEGADSSPEPTPADMRIGTQGIDLGSNDTSGEDDEEEPDSDDLAFMAHTSDPIEMASSSQPATPATQKRRGLKKKTLPPAATLLPVEDIDESDKESAMIVDDDDEPVVRRRKRVVADSDDSDE